MKFIFLVMCLLKESFAQIEEFSEGLCKFGDDDLILWGLNYVQCLDECRARDLCTSVNANLGVGECRLNFDSTIPEEPCDFYILSEKSDWKKKRLCYEDVKCSDEINAKTTAECECTIEECLPLTVPDNGVLMGTGRLIGHRVVVGCKNERGIITEYHQRNCIDKGIWSGETVVCPGTSGPKSDPVTETVQTRRTTTTTTTAAATTTTTDMAATTTTSTTLAVTNATIPTTTTSTTTADATSSTTSSSTTQTANETTTVGNDRTTEPQNTPDQQFTTNTHFTEPQNTPNQQSTTNTKTALPPDTLDDMSTTNTQTTRSPNGLDDMSTIKTQSTTLEPPITEKIITAPVTTRSGSSSLSSTATTTTTTTSTATTSTTATTTTTTTTTTSEATTEPDVDADYFMDRYNKSCDSSTFMDTYYRCDPEIGLECRLDRCQCMPPKVLDVTGPSCVITCPFEPFFNQTHASTYQEYAHYDLIPADTMTSRTIELYFRSAGSAGALPTADITEFLAECNKDETCRAVHLYVTGDSGELTLYHGSGDIQIIPTATVADDMRLYVRDCAVPDPTWLS